MHDQTLKFYPLVRMAKPTTLTKLEKIENIRKRRTCPYSHFMWPGSQEKNTQVAMW
jgi:hypothetical protein